MKRIFAIIVNYHSDDKVERLVKTITPAVSGVIVVDNNKINRGFAKGVNLGIKKALKKGADAVLLLNPDLKILPSQISRLITSPADVIGPVLTFTRYDQKIYDFGGKVNWLLGRTTHLELTNAHPKISNQIDYISGACMLIRADVFKRIGLFDERFFMYVEDVDFCLRARRAGFSVLVANDIFVAHQIEEHRFSQNFFKIRQTLKSNLYFISKWLPWWRQPVGFLYVVILASKIIYKELTPEPILEPFLRIIRFEKVLRHIKMNSVVVDIGCGHTPHLLNRLERYIESGIGIDQLTINNRMGKITLIPRQLSKKIPLKNNVADHVTLIAVLEHLQYPKSLLREAFRILKDGGTLIVTTPTPPNKPLLEFLSFRLGIVSKREIAEHKTYFWKKELQIIVRQAGFKRIRHEYFELFLNNFLVAEK